MQSSHPGHFFQTIHAQEDEVRRGLKSKNKHGRPIKLSSKALDVIADPLTADTPDPSVLVAESGGRVTRVNLRTGKVLTRFVNGIGIAPFTCLTVSRAIGKDGEWTVYAGCWDTKIYAWPLRGADIVEVPTDVEVKEGEAEEKGKKTVKPVIVQPSLTFSGHGDFVKSVKCIQFGPGQEYLLSGGMDSDLHIHDPKTGTQIRTVRGHTRGIQSITIDHMSSNMTIPTTTQDSFAIFFSADSTREILRWKLRPDGTVEPLPATGGVETESTTVDPLIRHETSVYKMTFDEDGDLWTASADLTVKCLSREDGFKTVVDLKHGRFVQDLLVNDERGFVIVACDDEDVWVWGKGSEEVYHKFVGHFGQVSALVMVGNILVSGSLDCTLRQWSLGREELGKAIADAAAEAASAALGDAGVEEAKEKKEALEALEVGKEKGKKGEIVLTAEEEAELAELMMSDDDE